METQCEHPSVTIYSRRIYAATRYESSEYQEWAERNECGKTGDPSDFPDADVTDNVNVGKQLRGMPHEHYD